MRISALHAADFDAAGLDVDANDARSEDEDGGVYDAAGGVEEEGYDVDD